MRCYELCLLQLLLGAALNLLLVHARSLNEDELQRPALSGQEKGRGDEVTSAGATKYKVSKEPVKKLALKHNKKKFDPDNKERKLAKAKSKSRPKRNDVVRQKGRPLTGRILGNTEFDGVRLTPFAGVSDLGSQIRSIIGQFSAKHTEDQDHSGGVGDVISALSDAISQSQQQVEDQVTVLREENSAQLAAVVAAVNQSADSLASLAETAEETHGFLQTIAHSLGSINAMLHQYMKGTPIIGTAIPLLEITTDTTSSPDATCTGIWERVGSDCVYISSQGPWSTNRPITKLSWHNAKEDCQNEGGALLEPTNIYILYDYLKENNLNYDYWVGGSDMNEDGNWSWVSGRPIASDAWSAQPRRDIYTNCLNFSTNEVLPLSAGDCDDISYYLCQQQPVAFKHNHTRVSEDEPVVFKLNHTSVSEESVLNQTTEGPAWSLSMKWSSVNVTERPLVQGSCEEPSFKIGSECFMVVDEQKSWLDARVYCQAEGYDLAEPENIEMLRQYLLDEGFDDDYWLGSSDAANEDEWLWLSGRPLSGEWIEGQPSGEGEQNCLDFQPAENPFFNDYFCSHEQRFICEREPMEQPADEGSMALEADSFINLLQGILTHPELALVQNETEPSNNMTETTDANNELNKLFQFLNIFKPSENTTETPEATDSNKEVNGLAQVLSLFKPSESTTESPGDAFSNNMNDFLLSISQMIHGTISQADGWCGPPLKLVGNECFFISDVLVDSEDAMVESELTWSDAQEFCKENGGDLAEPSDLQALKEIMTDGIFYWIGSKYNESEAMWKWVSGKNVELSEYADARPGICGTAIDVVSYGEEPSVGLDSDVCEKSQRWICKKPNPSITPLNTTASEVEPRPSITPLNAAVSEIESCMSPYEEVGSQCLYVGETEATWQEAQARCRDLNGSLAEITQEQNTVIDFLSSKAGSWSWAWIARTSVRNTDEWFRSQTSVRGRWVEVPDENYEGCLKLGVEYGGYKPYKCTDGGGHYICEKKVSSTVVASEEPSYLSVGTELFLVCNEKLSWSNAQRDCQRQSGYLAEPNNITALRNYLIENNYDDDYWIGGSDEVNEGSWIWTSSGDPIVDDWMEDQPGGEERQNCLDFQPKKTPSLNDYSCDVTQKYICQKLNTREHTGAAAGCGPVEYTCNNSYCIRKDQRCDGNTDCSDGSDEERCGHGNYTSIGTELFLIVKEKLSWSEAREYCKQNGGDLAAPKNLDLLKSYVKEEDEEHDYWLGGTDEAEEGTWTWLSGERIVDSWKANQPSGERTQNCLDFRSGHTPSLNDYECDEPQYFICQTEDSSQENTTIRVEPTTSSGIKLEDCNEPYFQIGNECFLIVNEEKAWHFARDYCQNQGDHLAVPANPDELADYLQKNQLVRDYWLGATDEVEEGTWISATGDSMIWTGTPPINQHENCLDFRSDRTPSYHDYFCENEQQFICERKIAIVSSDTETEVATTKSEELCVEPYVLIGSECFKIVHYGEASWDDAREDCINNGGDLAMPSNITKLITYLTENERTGDYWLGGSDIDEEGTWLWLSGEEITTGLSGGELRIDDTENCLDFRTNGFNTDPETALHDYYCSSSQKYICEKPLASSLDRNGTEIGVNEPMPQFAAIKFPSHDDLITEGMIDDGLIINEHEETIKYPNHNENKITYPETSPSNVECRDTRTPGVCVLTLEGGSCSCAEAKANGLCINSPHTQKTCMKTCGLCSFPDHISHLLTKASQCTIQTFIGLTRSAEHVDAELTLIKEYGRSETVNVTNEESHTFKGVDPGHYTLCVHTKVASNQLSQSNCSNIVVEAEVPGIPRNVQAIGFKNGSISVVWEAPDDSSCSANKYRVQLMQGLHNAIIGYQSTASLMANFDNVIPGFPYSIRVNAENALGEGNSTEIILNVPTDSCVEPFFALGETCYQIVQGSYNWFQARQLCQVQNADLVQNHSLTFLDNYLRDHDNDYVGFWMGASNENEEGNLEWISGKPSSQASIDRLPEFNSKKNCTTLIFDQNSDYNSDHDSCFNIEISNIICEKPPMTPSNYEKLYTQVGSEYFLVVKMSEDWAGAQAICQAKGGDLAQPKDLDLLRNWVNNFHSPDVFWLGASDMQREGDWVWLNGSNVEHGWMKGEPDNRDGSENCLLFMTKIDPSLNDNGCYRSQSFICELNNDETYAKEDPFILVGDEKFLVVEDWKTWEEARTSCQSFGGDLAEPKDLELLKRHLSENVQDDADYWIGGSDSGREGSWKWVSGAELDTSLWIDGEPDGDDIENCLDFQPQENPPLNDYECDETQYYICEKTSEITSEKTSENINVVSDKGCNSPFVQLGSECLLIITDHDKTWQDARDYCQKNDADLAILNDVRRLRKYLGRNDLEYDYWVGGSQQNSDGEWLWVNGDPFAEEWRDGEPDSSTESRCIDFQSQYRPSYNAYRCSGEQSFICEKPTISGKSVYDNKDKHPNNDLSSNFEKTDSLDQSTEETTEEIGTTVFPIESTDYYE